MERCAETTSNPFVFLRAGLRLRAGQALMRELGTEQPGSEAQAPVLRALLPPPSLRAGPVLSLALGTDCIV